MTDPEGLHYMGQVVSCEEVARLAMLFIEGHTPWNSLSCSDIHVEAVLRHPKIKEIAIEWEKK